MPTAHSLQPWTYYCLLGLLAVTLCAKMSETSRPSIITVGRGKKSHFDKHEQGKYFFRCVGGFGA